MTKKGKAKPVCNDCYVQEMTEEEAEMSAFNPCSGCGPSHGSYPHFLPRTRLQEADQDGG